MLFNAYRSFTTTPSEEHANEFLKLSDGRRLNCEDAARQGRPSRGRAGQAGRELVRPALIVGTDTYLSIADTHPPRPASNVVGTIHEEDPMSAQPNAPGPRQNSRDDLLTLQEACVVLRVPEGTLRYWRHLGCGPRSFKVGRHVRYWRADLVLWLTEQTNRPQDRR